MFILSPIIHIGIPVLDWMITLNVKKYLFLYLFLCLLKHVKADKPSPLMKDPFLKCIQID